MSWQPFCVDPSGRTSDGMRGDAGAQRPCTRLEARSPASRRGSGGGVEGRQWPTSPACTQDASGTHSRRLTPPVTSRGGHGSREQQPGDVRSSRPLRPAISLRGTPQRATLEIPRVLGHPQMAPHLGRPMAGGARRDAAREEVSSRMACGVVLGGGKSRQVPPGKEVGGQHKPRRMKSLMGVGGGVTAGAWVTYGQARACAWSTSRRVERVSDVPRNEIFRAALALILWPRERLRDVDGGQTHLEKILRHMEHLHELNWDLLGQDYDGYDGDGPSGGVSERMIAAGLGERGSLDIPLDVWNANIPTRLMWDIRSRKSGQDCGRFDVWQPSLHTRRMIGVLVDDGFLCPDLACLGTPEWENLPDNVSAFVKPKNDVKCSFTIDMRNLNDCSKVPLRKVKLLSIHTVFQTIQREIYRGAPLRGITLDISNFYWSLQIPAERRGLFRIQGAHFHCLPFGWKFTPVLAQDPLAALLREFFDNHAVGLNIHRFHYLDDVLILSRDRECMDCLGPRLAAFLMEKGLCISTKSCLKPRQNVLWLGKVFDLAKGEVRNTDKMRTKCLGIAIKTACSPVSPKVAERVTGKMQWAFGPRKGVTLYLQGWPRFQWGHHRFQHRPSPALISALFDALAISYVPATVDPMPGHFGFAPFLLVDAAEAFGWYRLGISGRNGVMRARKIPAKNQQQAELSGVLHACRFAVTQKWHRVSLFVDNTAACYSAANMRASTRACTQVKILRVLWNLLWHTLTREWS